MGDSDWFVAGIIVGIAVGIPLGWILAQVIAKPAQPPASILFDRDSEGRITAIHYAPRSA
jgi:ABC-type antimicrobial peptide transport system permease subunit